MNGSWEGSAGRDGMVMIVVPTAQFLSVVSVISVVNP